jgi:anti-anti-sigma factor
MRKSVPFIGEEMIVRDDAEKITSNKTNIDDVLRNDGEASSWDDASLPKPQRPGRRTKAFSAVSKANTHTSRLGGLTDTSNTNHLEWMPINNGHCLRINVNGSTDLHLFEEWKRLLRETADNSISQFEFNLAQMPELNLTGLGMLLYFKDQKRSQRQDIKLCHCNPRIRELLQSTGMEKYFVVQGNPPAEDR